MPLLLTPEPRSQACQGCTELRAYRRQEGVRESSHGFPGGPMDSVTCLLPGAHISQTEDGAGMRASPQWSGLPAGTHCHAPPSALLEPTVRAEEGWRAPFPLLLVPGLLPGGRAQREGPREGGVAPSWCCVVSVYCGLLQRSQNCARGEIRAASLLHSAARTCAAVPWVPAATTKSCTWTWCKKGPRSGESPNFSAVSIAPLCLRRTCSSPF